MAGFKAPSAPPRKATLDFSKVDMLVVEVEDSEYSYDACMQALDYLSLVSTTILQINNPEMYAKVLDAGVCEAVVQILITHSSNSVEASAAACTIIKNLCYGSKDLAEHFADSGACEAVVDAAAMHIGEAEVADAAAGAIGMLARNNISHSYLLAQAGACDILAQLGNYGFNVRNELCAIISANVCYAFSQLAEASNANDLMNAGACELVVSLVTFHHDNALVVVPGVKAICCLASLNFECRECLGRVNACELLVECIARFCDTTTEEAVDEKRLSDEGCGFQSPQTENLGVPPDRVARQTSDMSVNSTASDLTTDSHSSHFALRIGKMFSSASLASLASATNTPGTPANLGSPGPIASPKGGDVVVSSTAAVPGFTIHASPTTNSYLAIAQDGCEAIMHLALCPNNADRLGNHGACEVIIRNCCSRLSEVSFGAEICTGALLHLCTYGVDAMGNRAKLAALDAVSVCKTLQLSPKVSYRARENILQLFEYLGVSCLTSPGNKHLDFGIKTKLETNSAQMSRNSSQNSLLSSPSHAIPAGTPVVVGNNVVYRVPSLQGSNQTNFSSGSNPPSSAHSPISDRNSTLGVTQSAHPTSGLNVDACVESNDLSTESHNVFIGVINGSRAIDGTKPLAVEVHESNTQASHRRDMCLKGVHEI